MGIFSKLKKSFQQKSDSDRYLSGLDKSKRSFSERIRRLSLGFRGIDEEFLEELMVALLAVSYTHLNSKRKSQLF